MKGRYMTNSVEQQQQCLENLLLSDDFIELCTMKKDFNIFHALKLQNNEVIHKHHLLAKYPFTLT